MPLSTNRLMIIACTTSLLAAAGGAAAAAPAADQAPADQAAGALPTYEVIAVLDDGDDTPVGRGMNETGTIVGRSGYPLKAFEWTDEDGLTLLRVRLKGSAGIASVRVVDDAGAPVRKALVEGAWSVNGDVVRDGDTDRTDRKGRAELRQRLDGLTTGDEVEFCITDITHEGYTYDPPAPSCDSVTVR